MQIIDEFFQEYETSRPIFDALCGAINVLGPAEMRVTKSQVAFRRRAGFAWAWVPARYLRLRAAPLVLTLALRRRDTSPRWKEIVEPVAEHFAHHLELYSVEEIDDEVRGWLREAWTEAA